MGLEITMYIGRNLCLCPFPFIVIFAGIHAVVFGNYNYVWKGVFPWARLGRLSVSLNQVHKLFARFGLLEKAGEV